MTKNHSMEQQSAPPDAAHVDDDGRALKKTAAEYVEVYKKYSCEGCLAFLNAGSEQQEIVCQSVSDWLNSKVWDVHTQCFLDLRFGDRVCLEMLEECSSNTNTPTARCQTFGACVE